MATHTETAAYRLETEGNGLFVTITRKADGASVFMQGDDAAECLRTVDSLPSMFDYYCSQYDEVMTL